LRVKRRTCQTDVFSLIETKKYDDVPWREPETKGLRIATAECHERIRVGR
jgi:hypothetical protein